MANEEENTPFHKKIETLMDELKKTLQQSVLDEIQELKSRLQTQEEFWKNKFAASQQENEKQIQQLQEALQKSQEKPLQKDGKDAAAPAPIDNDPIERNNDDESTCDNLDEVDGISDYTLSEAIVDLNRVKVTNCQPDDQLKPNTGHQQRGKCFSQENLEREKKALASAAKAKRMKKYKFDEAIKKLVDVYPDEIESDEDDDDDDDEEEDEEDCLSYSEDNRAERKSRKNQLDLVRVKTLTELEGNMADIGLNPEITAIGLGEMGRALKHLKAQRRATGNEIQANPERFEEERESVKTFAKFAATKLAIDEKLNAISNLNPNHPEKTSLGKMFRVVKQSGKNLTKRVASVVRKHHTENSSDEDEQLPSAEDKKAEKKRKNKAPALKTTFFTKARWTRKKNKEKEAAKSVSKASTKKITENSNAKKSAIAGRNDGNESEASEETTSGEESGEETSFPPYMTRSRPILPAKREKFQSVSSINIADNKIKVSHNQSNRSSVPHSPRKSGRSNSDYMRKDESGKTTPRGKVCKDKALTESDEEDHYNDNDEEEDETKGKSVDDVSDYTLSEPFSEMGEAQKKRVDNDNSESYTSDPNYSSEFPLANPEIRQPSSSNIRKRRIVHEEPEELSEISEEDEDEDEQGQDEDEDELDNKDNKDQKKQVAPVKRDALDHWTDSTEYQSDDNQDNVEKSMGRKSELALLRARTMVTLEKNRTTRERRSENRYNYHPKNTYSSYSRDNMYV